MAYYIRRPTNQTSIAGQRCQTIGHNRPSGATNCRGPDADPCVDDETHHRQSRPRYDERLSIDGPDPGVDDGRLTKIRLTTDGPDPGVSYGKLTKDNSDADPGVDDGKLTKDNSDADPGVDDGKLTIDNADADPGVDDAPDGERPADGSDKHLVAVRHLGGRLWHDPWG